VGEYISNSLLTVSAPTSSYVTGASIALTAGDWDISASAVLLNDITTASDRVVTGLLTTPGDTTGAGQTLGFSYLRAHHQLNDDLSFTFPTIRATCDGTNIYLHRDATSETVSGTTLALRLYTGVFTVGSAAWNGFLSARRVR
jgi:hypothetical protein